MQNQRLSFHLVDMKIFAKYLRRLQYKYFVFSETNYVPYYFMKGYFKGYLSNNHCHYCIYGIVRFLFVMLKDVEDV